MRQEVRMSCQNSVMFMARVRYLVIGAVDVGELVILTINHYHNPNLNMHNHNQL